MSNPFTQVLDALWDLFEDWPTIDTLVPPGNRIKVNSLTNRVPTKSSLGTSDYPAVMLYSTAADVNTHASSSASRIVRDYVWAISSGDLRYVVKLAEIEWALYCCMHNWKTVLTPLTWNSRRFVKLADVVSVSNGLFEPQPNRVTGLRGWSASWACRIHMEFKTTDLTDQLGSSSGGS